MSHAAAQHRQQKSINAGPLLDKLPPSAIEAECAVLGSMILDWKVCGEVLQIIRSAEDFYKPAHGTVYAALIELYDQVQSIDMVQLAQKLTDKGVLEQVGGVDYLIELFESVPSAVSAGHYARLVREKAIVRHLIDASARMLHDCYHTDDAADELLNRAGQAIYKLQEDRGIDEPDDLSSLLDQTMHRLEEQDGRTLSGLGSGFFELDDMTNGLHPGEMTILAARPSIGKTAFMLNLVEHIGAVVKEPVAVFSLEMSKQQLTQRLLCSRSGVDSQKLRKNMLSRDDFGQLQMAVGELAEAPIYIDDTPGLNLMQLRAKARRMATEHSIKTVFIDYLQLMSEPGCNSRQEEVSNLSRGIKGLARELAVPVVCLSQLNRQAEQREGHRPRMSDLRESGAIEQDADVVAMLHREDYYHRADPDYQPNHEAELIIAKQRNGPTGVVKMQFHGPTTRFNNLAGVQR
ncbi:MAG: replicative DNA helicase [Planctomycetota bacterium]